ncbi:MAG: hypothetical protein QOH93_2717 [Chloroflexia bacterium]|jgi:hypothetical protein|nr:hypothetical protein [Chloroflexia bacterium]
MSSEPGGTVVAAFRTEEDAESALEALQARGLATEDISVLTRDKARGSRVGFDLGSNVLVAAGLGALFGAIVVGAAAWLLALGSMAQPGQGPSSGVGSIAATVTGALVGALVGGLLGGLVGLTIPAAKEADDSVDAGIVVHVRTPADIGAAYVEELLASNGAQEVHTEAAPAVSLVEPVPLVADTSAEPSTGASAPMGYEDFSGLQALARDEEEPDMQGRWTADEEPLEETFAEADETPAEAEVERDVDESTGETGWYESLSHPPTTAEADAERATDAGMTEDQETWADIANLERQEESGVNENPEGTNQNTVTGTQGSINPDTGTYGTAGTPVTTGHGTSGSTIGTGTAGGEEASQSGDFRGATPDTAAYEMGGRASTDSQASLEGGERDATVEDKYARTDTDAAPIQQDPGTVDVYEAGPSYGPGVRQEVDRTDLYSSSDVDTAPTHAVTPTDESHESAGTDIPGTADPRGLGDNTDDQS